MCWMMPLSDCMVEVKANSLLLYSMHRPRTDDPKFCSCELCNKIVVLSTAKDLERLELDCLGVWPPLLPLWLQRLDVRIGPREHCQFQQYLLFYFILLTGISINRCFPCQYSPVASLRPAQFKYSAFALGLIARVWPHLSHIFPSSPKQQPGNFCFIS